MKLNNEFNPVLYVLLIPLVLTYGVLAGLFNLVDWLFGYDHDERF